jgi:uncharacterized protein (DUF1800 family)
MIIYLDSATNRKGQPNENFAREVMELFTLGEGHYTETDVKEAARAYTGWSLDPDTGAYMWRPRIHDDDSKTVLGHSGNYDGDAVLDILLSQPACSEFIVRKLWMEFVSTDVDSPANLAEIRRVAAQFRNSRYDIKTALRAIFLSPAFYAQENSATLVKSPVELVVGTIRELGVHYTDPIPFVFLTASLGQNLFTPPNVRGWPGGDTWINSTTLLARKQFVERLTRVDEMRETSMPAPDMQSGAGAAASGDTVTRADMREVKGGGRLGQAGRERLVQAAAGIQFDSRRYLGEFTGKDDTALELALLPGRPANPLASDMPRPQLLKAVLLDPMYQLK